MSKKYFSLALLTAFVCVSNLEAGKKKRKSRARWLPLEINLELRSLSGSPTSSPEDVSDSDTEEQDGVRQRDRLDRAYE